jgi:CBS domain-containing protein
MSELSKYCIGHHSTVMNAIEIIQRNMIRCCIVLNEGKVVGVFSEGDVLRVILQDISLYTPLANVLKPSFQYLKSRDMAKATALVRKHGISLIPVVGENFELEGVVTLFDVMEHLADDSNS